MVNSYCKKHDEIEPEDWWDKEDGLWVCPVCVKEYDTKTSIKCEQIDKAIKNIVQKHKPSVK